MIASEAPIQKAKLWMATLLLADFGMSPRHHPQMELSFPECQDSKINRLIGVHPSLPSVSQSSQALCKQPTQSETVLISDDIWTVCQEAPILSYKSETKQGRTPSFCSKSHFTKNETQHVTNLHQLWFQLPATLSRLSRSHNMNVAHVPRGFFKTSFNLVTSWDSSCTFFRVSSIFLAFVIASPHLVTFSTRDFSANSTHQLGNLVPFQLQLKHFRFLCQTLGEKKPNGAPLR